MLSEPNVLYIEISELQKWDIYTGIRIKERHFSTYNWESNPKCIATFRVLDKILIHELYLSIGKKSRGIGRGFFARCFLKPSSERHQNKLIARMKFASYVFMSEVGSDSQCYLDY